MSYITIHDITNNIDKWRLVTPDDEIQYLEGIKNIPKSKGGKSRGAHWNNCDLISSLDIYSYLKARFGPPNGFQMHLKKPNSDNLIHWNYTLIANGARIDFVGFRLRYTVSITNVDEDFGPYMEIFFKAICDDFKNHRKAINDVKKGLEKWDLFINPYFRLSSVVEDLYTQLIDLKVESVHYPKFAQINSSDGMEKYDHQFKQAANTMSAAQTICTSLMMVIPIWAESFVNLVIFILAKSEIKSDKRLYEDLLRKNIDVRLKTLHLHCDGFSNWVPDTDSRFKMFMKLMNRRNFLLHGNVDPKFQKFEVMYFDKDIPLVDDNKDFANFILTKSLAGTAPSTILQGIETVEGIISLVIECLEPTSARQLMILMNESIPGWNDSTSRTGILLPETMVDGVFVGLSSDEEKYDD